MSVRTNLKNDAEALGMNDDFPHAFWVWQVSSARELVWALRQEYIEVIDVLVRTSSQDRPED